MNPSFFLILFGGLALMPLAAQTPPVATTTNVPAASETPPKVAASNSPSAPVDTAQPLATAVLNFQSSDETMNQQGAEMATLLEADLSTSEHAVMVEREEVDKVLNEQELGASGLVSADTAAKIGSMTGAKVLVTGRLFAVGNQFMAVAKIISTETSRVYGVTVTFPDAGNLAQAAQDLSGKIDGVLAGGIPRPTPATAPGPDRPASAPFRDGDDYRARLHPAQHRSRRPDRNHGGIAGTRISTHRFQ
jgi:hypothetical protein